MKRLWRWLTRQPEPVHTTGLIRIDLSYWGDPIYPIRTPLRDMLIRQMREKP